MSSVAVATFSARPAVRWCERLVRCALTMLEAEPPRRRAAAQAAT